MRGWHPDEKRSDGESDHPLVAECPLAARAPDARNGPIGTVLETNVHLLRVSARGRAQVHVDELRLVFGDSNRSATLSVGPIEKALGSQCKPYLDGRRAGRSDCVQHLDLVVAPPQTTTAGRLRIDRAGLSANRE